MMRLALLALLGAGANALAPPKRTVSKRSRGTSAKPNVNEVEAPVEFFDPEIRPITRTAGCAALWLGLTAYVAIGAPGKDDLSQALDADALARLIADPFDPTVPPLFCVLFNFMGLWPAIYAALLLPGGRDQKPPLLPFLLGSVGLGMFALTPYLALREERTEAIAPSSLAGKWFDGKANAALLSVGAVFVAYKGITAAPLAESIAGFQEIFQEQLFVHVTTLDFCSLWLLSFGVIAEDMKRRPDGPDPSLAPAFAAVPIFGALAYLAVRPPLPTAEE
ncbi:hypothetical protein M885DRAFT_521894 [Pelagophyceae sp. CCMP2097]|nr:hypothetical protein M885DRAFT_521894 [Pelagophyceae sp. CCMP2097]